MHVQKTLTDAGSKNYEGSAQAPDFCFAPSLFLGSTVTSCIRLMTRHVNDIAFIKTLH